MRAIWRLCGTLCTSSLLSALLKTFAQSLRHNNQILWDFSPMNWTVRLSYVTMVRHRQSEPEFSQIPMDGCSLRNLRAYSDLNSTETSWNSYIWLIAKKNSGKLSVPFTTAVSIWYTGRSNRLDIATVFNVRMVDL